MDITWIDGAYLKGIVYYENSKRSNKVLLQSQPYNQL